MTIDFEAPSFPGSFRRHLVTARKACIVMSSSGHLLSSVTNILIFKVFPSPATITLLTMLLILVLQIKGKGHLFSVSRSYGRYTLRRLGRQKGGSIPLHLGTDVRRRFSLRVSFATLSVESADEKNGLS